MSLSIFELIYDSMNSFFGLSWITWALLFIGFIVVFGALLRIPFIILLAVGSLPFLLLAMYSAIQVSGWVMFLTFVVFGMILSISLWRLFTR